MAEENSGIQYETDVPAVPQNEGSNIPSKKNSGGSNPSDESAEANGSNTPGGAGSGGGDGSNTGGTGTGQSTQGSGGGDGKGANGAKPAGSIGSGQKLATAPSANSVQAADDDGSSPLVPILIAVAVLAAISIGAYYYRQRRQGPDSTVAPPAS